MNLRPGRAAQSGVPRTGAASNAVRPSDVPEPRLVPAGDVDRVSSRQPMQDVELLEREPVLADLDGLLRDAADGRGRIATISGEAA